METMEKKKNAWIKLIFGTGKFFDTRNPNKWFPRSENKQWKQWKQ